MKLIPFDLSDGFSDEDELVFDQLSYSKIGGNVTNPWRQRILSSILRTHTCLFIGLSGTDDNFDSLLADCMETHIALADNVQFWGITFDTPPEDEVAKMSWECRKVFYKIMQDYEQALPKFLFEICQRAAIIRKPRLG